MPASRQRLLLPCLCAALLLAGCNSQLNVDLAAAAPNGASKVVLGVTAIDLQDPSSNSKEYSSEPSQPTDLLPYSHSQNFNTASTYQDRLELIKENKVSGNFVGIRPIFDAANAYMQLRDGTQLPITISSQASYAAISLSLSSSKHSGSDSEDVVVTLELPFSLVKNADGRAYQLTPVIRAANPGSAGTISGSLPASAVTGGNCNSTSGSGVAIYVYSGSNVTPVDYYRNGAAANANQPLASSLLSYNTASNTYLFEIRYLPAGSYTAAWTCDASNDAPNTSDALSFLATRNVTVSAGNSTAVSFSN